MGKKVLKAGDIIPFNKVDHLMSEANVKAQKEWTTLAKLAALNLNNLREEYFKQMYAAHPELEVWEFTVHHAEKHIKLDYRRDE